MTLKSCAAPRISIVTPSLNQGQFIEETIQSVLTQDYPELDYIVIDGGSSDNTLSILKRYEGQIRWISENDEGQSDAINKGLRLATGEICAYLNADDILLPGALKSVGAVFVQQAGILWLSGRCKIIDERGKEIRSAIQWYKNFLLGLRSYHLLLVTNYISQPSTFWRTKAMQDCGPFNEQLNFVMDYEYWLRLWKLGGPYILHQNLAGFRVHDQSKTTSDGHNSRYIDEEYGILSPYADSDLWLCLHGLHRVLMTNTYSQLNKGRQQPNDQSPARSG